MSGQYDEGHTLAGWAGFTVATAGTGVCAFGITVWRPAIWLGLAVIVVAAMLTWVLHLAGWGKPPGPRPADQWSMRVRDRTAREGHPDCRACRLSGRHVSRDHAPEGTVPAKATTVPEQKTPVPEQERTVSLSPTTPPATSPTSPTTPSSPPASPPPSRESVG